jgi:hypothetical protein
MKQILTDIQVDYDEPIPIYCENTSAIGIDFDVCMRNGYEDLRILPRETSGCMGSST